MKRILLFAAFAAALLFSCTREEQPSNAPASASDPVSDFVCDLGPESETEYSLIAGFEGAEESSRSTLSLDDATSLATVVWTAGDTFNMFGNGSYAPYSTTQSGPSVTFTTRYSVSGPCYCLYPAQASPRAGTLDGVFHLIASLPSNQTAVAGGIANGLNIATAYSTSQTANLTFKSVPSYIRFRLSGGAVSSVKKVTFDAGTLVAGDLTIDVGTDGVPDVSFKYNWSNPVVERSNKIILSGDFVAGVDYLIALAPCTVNGFNMIFEDAEGHRIRRHSDKSMTFQRSQIQDFGTIGLGDAFPSADTGEGMIQYRTATMGARPVDICVISEGFRTEELPFFVELAENAVGFLFNVEPFKTYKDYFNVYFMKVPSAESGASITDGNHNIITARDTYFGARWGAGRNEYDDMEADESTVYGYVSEHCPEILAGTHTIDEVPVLMIINDSRYGGINHVSSNGRSYCMAPYTDNGGSLTWMYPGTVPVDDLGPDAGARARTAADLAEVGTNTGDWRNTMLHEFGGHCFGRLGDEYWGTKYYSTPQPVNGHNWPVPIALNVTENRDNPTWKAELLDIQDQLVALDPHYGRIGVFQGAGTEIFNKWRSEKISCMIDNRRYFSAWQRILIVKRIMQLAGETYSAESFFANDYTVDPVRDEEANPVMGHTGVDEPRLVPLLPPPVLHEE